MFEYLGHLIDLFIVFVWGWSGGLVTIRGIFQHFWNSLILGMIVLLVWFCLRPSGAVRYLVDMWRWYKDPSRKPTLDPSMNDAGKLMKEHWPEVFFPTLIIPLWKLQKMIDPCLKYQNQKREKK